MSNDNGEERQQVRLTIPNIQNIITKFIDYCQTQANAISNRKVPQYHDPKNDISYMARSYNYFGKEMELRKFKKRAIPICAWLKNRDIQCSDKGFICDFSSFSSLIYYSSLENYEKLNLVFYIILLNLLGGALGVEQLVGNSVFLETFSKSYRHSVGFNNNLTNFCNHHFAKRDGLSRELYDKTSKLYDAKRAFNIITNKVKCYDDLFLISQDELTTALELLNVGKDLIDTIMKTIKDKNKMSQPSVQKTVSSHPVLPTKESSGTNSTYESLMEKIRKTRKLRNIFSHYPDLVGEGSTKENPKIYSLDELIEKYREAIELGIDKERVLDDDGREKNEILSHNFLMHCFNLLSDEKKDEYISEIKEKYCRLAGVAEVTFNVEDSEAFISLVIYIAENSFTKTNENLKAK